MARNGPVDVKQIIETDLNDDIIQTYLDSACTLIDTYIGTLLPDPLLKEIEKWLAAHFLAVSRERQPEQASAGSTSIKYQGATGLGLDATMYGQQVKLLDTTGKLSALGGTRAFIKAVKGA